MGKRFLTILAVAVLMCSVALLGLSGAAEQKVPDDITIQAKLWKNHTKSPVKLSHKKHSEEYGAKCADCHHVIENGKNVWKEGDKVQKCMECHNEPTIKGEKKLPKDKQALNLKLAFHNNCQGCHKKLKKKDKVKYKDIPTTCIKCHPKKKK
ncbi:cytochrome C [candidate division KSB1 bacterium]|nr:cytochrome c3 family protein [Deltaproteobacteria bacterium]NIV70585.1 cytochrome C [Phycisphaerae bacterium]NIW18077.1 cytochrome C [candidate division KSB1 bacterium]